MVAALVIAAALVASACSQSGAGRGEGSTLLARARTEGLRIGHADERPFAYETSGGRLTGSAPTVARAVLTRLGVDRITGVRVDFGQLVTALDAGRIDVIGAGMFITEERAGSALFTDPDMCVLTALAVGEGNPHRLSDFGSVTADPDVHLGVVSGAAEQRQASEAGVPQAQLTRFPSIDEMATALLERRIDAFAATSVSARAAAREGGFDVLAPFAPSGPKGCSGYAFRFEDKEFRDGFNRVLNEMKAAGEILPLVAGFGFSADEVDAASGLTVDDVIGVPYDFAGRD